MIVNLKLKDSDIKKLLKELVILIDTREKENQHITDYFTKNNIKYKVKALDFCDYSAELNANEELGLPYDISLENVVAIERKGSGKYGINEISLNLTQGRTAFENEFIRAKEKCKKVYLLIENGSWKDIENHNYISQFNENAFYNSLLSWRNKYNFQIDFVDSDSVAKHIYKIICTVLSSILKE